MMATTILPLSSPVHSTTTTQASLLHPIRRRSTLHSSLPRFIPPPLVLRHRPLLYVSCLPSSTPSDSTAEEEDTTTTATDSSSSSPPSEVSVEEIKEKLAAARAGAGEKKAFWEGVTEEIGEIEWPVFGKVMGTTGVVISVIVGSSIALLTVNAVLAEISDRVFAGKGIQDFFA